MEAKLVLVETNIGKGATFCVVDVECYDVVTFHEGCPSISRQVHPDVLPPLLFRHVHEADTVDVGFANVVVRVDNPKVALEVVCRQSDVATDVAVGIVACPIGLAVSIFALSSPGAC